MSLFSRIDTLVNKMVKNKTLWFFVGLLLLGGFAVLAYHIIFPLMPEPAVYGSLEKQKEQAWDDDQREKYYQTSQGTLVIPFTWFMSLERQPTGFPPELGEVDLFSSPGVQARYGLLPDTSKYNPHLLPVGLVRDVLDKDLVDLLGEGQPEWIGISCAACHTGQIQYKGRALRIDGGQSMWNFAQWSNDMVGNLVLTASLPKRFDRFARRVFAYERRPYNKANLQDLRDDLKVYFNSPLITQAVDATFNNTYPATEGNTRTAALGRGVNGEFGLLDSRNVVRNRGPVSFPPLWYTHDYDWVQSVAAIGQPMGRNITEAWGVSVRIQLDQPEQWASTARLHDMFWMETLLSVLKPPRWPEHILGKIDWKKVERGRHLYEKAVWDGALPPAEEQLPANPAAFMAAPNPSRVRTGYCARCHSPALDPWPSSDAENYIQLPMYRLAVLGTDPYDAEEFAARQPYTGKYAYLFNGVKQLPNVGPVLKTATSGVQTYWYGKRNVDAECQEIMNGFRENNFRAPLAYPARPLAGYWATGPFLHNGSVRTLYQLLSPVEDREKEFYLGSYEFDPLEVGYRNHRFDGAFEYKTSVKGNSNAGHEFRNAPRGTAGVIGPELSPADRQAIIEYMKVMDDVKESGFISPRSQAQRRAILAMMRPSYEAKTSYAGYQEAPEDMTEFCNQLKAIMGPGAYPAGQDTESVQSPPADPTPGAAPAPAASNQPPPAAPSPAPDGQ